MKNTIALELIERIQTKQNKYLDLATDWLLVKQKKTGWRRERADEMYKLCMKKSHNYTLRLIRILKLW